jgi:hypothetical protein
MKLFSLHVLCNVVAVTALSAVTLAAQATPQLAATGLSTGDNNLRLNNFSGGTTYGSQWLGAQQFTYGGGSPFWAYCIDPKTSTTLPSTGYTMADLAAFMSDSAGYAGQMTSSGYTATMAANGYGVQTNTAVVASRLRALYSYAFQDSLGNAQKAAAFGYAAWEIMGSPTASGLSRTSGSGLLAISDGTTDGNTIAARVDQLLTAVNTNTAAGWAAIGLNTAFSYVYTVYYDPAPHSTQNFMTARPTGISAPGTLALAGLGLLGAAFLRRRNA